jgi:NTE family protein
MSDTARLGLVLSGGGARGAYEAGVLHYIRTALPAEYRHAKFSVITGASVGAINAAQLASTADRPDLQGSAIKALWENLDQNQIFRRDWGAVTRFIVNSLLQTASNFLRLNPGKPELPLVGRSFVSLFDTSPFPAYLSGLIDFQRIQSNIRSGALDALALTVTSLSTDHPELFIAKGEEVGYRGDYQWYDVQIGVAHVMASAAIPFAFPPVVIDGHYYCDGGVRLNTPMSPAIQLGADRILVIGMHTDEANKHESVEPPGYRPGAGRMLAAISESIFSDRVRYDMEQLGRINRIIEWGEAVYGEDFLTRINSYLVTQGLRGDIANRGLKKIQRLSIFPSRDMADVFEEHLKGNAYFDKSFSPFERFVMRLFDMDPREGREVFSYLMFSPVYIKNLLQLGYDDAAAKREELIAFFAGEAIPAHFPQPV